MCPNCGSNDVGHYTNGLCFCRMCGNTWEVKVEKQKASVISSVSATNNLKLKILYDNEALNGFIGAFGFSCLIKEKGIYFLILVEMYILCFLTCKSSK
jgi:hypothetical protein